MGNPFLFQHVSPTATKNANPQVCSSATAKTAKQKTHTFREQRRTQNFSRAFDCGYSYFSRQKHAAVRCVQSSGVSPAVLRRCKAVYPCAYSRNKAKKRFVLVQRFMPAYALCRNIIKLYKNQYGRGEHLLGANADIFSQQKHAAVRCVRNGSAQPFAAWSNRFLCAHSLLSTFKRFLQGNR